MPRIRLAQPDLVQMDMIPSAGATHDKDVASQLSPLPPRSYIIYTTVSKTLHPLLYLL
jgi:hypothetical protein